MFFCVRSPCVCWHTAKINLYSLQLPLNMYLQFFLSRRNVECNCTQKSEHFRPPRRDEKQQTNKREREEKKQSEKIPKFEVLLKTLESFDCCCVFVLILLLFSLCLLITWRKGDAAHKKCVCCMRRNGVIEIRINASVDFESLLFVKLLEFCVTIKTNLADESHKNKTFSAISPLSFSVSLSLPAYMFT